MHDIKWAVPKAWAMLLLLAGLASCVPGDPPLPGDQIGDLIGQIEAGDALRPKDEINRLGGRQGGDAGLAEDALNAALGLLKSKENPLSIHPRTFLPAYKPAGHLRVGLLLPLSGEFKKLGEDIASGVEMALFQLGHDSMELFYFDTQAGKSAAEASIDAIATDVDIVIGPLFTGSAVQTRNLLGVHGIPALSLSNNVNAAGPGHWVLGYVPEQQIDYLLGHVLGHDKTRIAILASEDRFGQRLLSHSQMRLASLGMAPAEVMILGPRQVADDESLREAIQKFSHYEEPPEDVKEEEYELPPPAYDALIIAGETPFILRTVPVLSFYDLGPERVTYLGTDLWARTELTAEPSLQGSLVTKAVIPEHEFDTNWRQYFRRPPSEMVRLGYDAMAVISLVHKQQKLGGGRTDWRANLINEQGFSGVSGRFNLLPDGQNQRVYDIFMLSNNRLRAQ